MNPWLRTECDPLFFAMRDMDIKSEFKSMIKPDKRLSDRVRLENLSHTIRKASKLLAHSGDTRFWWPVLVVL